MIGFLSEARWRCRWSRCGCSACWCSPAARCCRAMSAAPCSARSPTSARSTCSITKWAPTGRCWSNMATGSRDFVSGDMGKSYAYRAPVAPFLLTARWSIRPSSPLVAFLLVVPLGILGGVVAALNRGRPIDRIITLVGLSATVVPEFVSGIVLILIFGVWLQLAADLGHLAARAPALLTQLYLSAPAVDAAGPGPVRLHRPHGAGRHDRGARFRLYAHRHPQGPAAAGP